MSSSSRTAAPGSRRSRFSNIPETFLQALSRVSLAGWFVADAGGDVCFLSDRFKDIAGRAEEALLGNGWQNALAAEDRPRVEAEWRSAVDRGRGWRSEFRLRRPDGGTAGVRGQAEPERDGRGRVRRFVGTLTELSERKEVETAVREKSRLLET
ncbi:MAG: PAS domain-containing protein, partial [Nitrospinaceae bacterium]|nr:PAS domain-containing protein [Nitrospinaceae bacterium]NIT81062.1 PAS domain-containing protein [Nitrospinaceae bacterium]NIU95468.1 PAS domain-containing protein [Nitrospinaceae bacterium]NIY14117.1 PAS domain-containing protein [Nitrospinaceae bacterium]